MGGIQRVKEGMNGEGNSTLLVGACLLLKPVTGSVKCKLICLFILAWLRQGRMCDQVGWP